MLKKFLVIIILLFITINLYSQSIKLNVTPGVELPFGPLSSSGEKMYTLGGSVNLNGDIPFSAGSPFFGRALLDYSFVRHHLNFLHLLVWV